MDPNAPAPGNQDHIHELDIDGRRYRICLPDAATDHIQGKIAREGAPYEAEMLEDMRGRFSAGDLVLDIGANIGNHSLYLAAVAGCRVELFEPNDSLCDAIAESIRQNPELPPITIHRCGLGKQADIAEFDGENPQNRGAQSLSVGSGAIPVIPLDSLSFDAPVRGMKIDVEGMEIDVLNGARATITRDRPLIYIECITEAHYRTIAKWLESHGYSYFGTFNATPTHLFMPNDSIDIETRLTFLQHKAAQGEYRNLQLLRELRNRIAPAERREQEAKEAARTAQGRAIKAEKALQEAEKQARQHAGIEQQLAVREAQMAALERRITALDERNQRDRDSIAYRLGTALMAVGKSPDGLWRLPGRLRTLRKDVLARRAAFRTAQNTAASGISLEPKPQNPALLRQVPEDLRTLKVACVMDEFTLHAFAPECDLLPLDPDRWQAQLDQFRPDLVLIESAWRGTEGKWSLKVSNPSPEIMGVIDWCRRQRVPSAFWNKEDPVHFDGFQHIATAVDYIFTTDSDCIARYQQKAGHGRVYLLPFAAQPADHNPIERFTRRQAFCFAGSYYLKYPERQRDLARLIDCVEKIAPIEIYDRNYGNPHPHYEFPREYTKYIVGNLPFDQIDKAYKGYVFGINMNTIKQSQTMFARRVFELLASNTVVVSNYSRGVRSMFGELVVCSDDAAELDRRLADLGNDEIYLRKLRLAGVRKILSEHCYVHRLAYLVSKLADKPVVVPTVEIVVMAWPTNPAELAHIRQSFAAQKHQHRRLVLVGSEALRADASAAADGTETWLAPEDREALTELLAQTAWVAPWSASDHYGPHYLTDLALALRYTASDAIGKGAHYMASPAGVMLQDTEQRYRQVSQLEARAMMARGAWLAAHLPQGDNPVETWVVTGPDLLSIDEFNYCRDGGIASGQNIADIVDDLPNLWTGTSLEGTILPITEKIHPKGADADGHAANHFGKSAEELARLLPSRLPSGLSGTLENEVLSFSARLAPDRHAYVYLNTIFTRAELNLVMNSRIELLGDPLEPGLEVRTVFEFLDSEKVKISHAMHRVGAAYSMAIPSRCEYIRFGLRFQGSGTMRLHRLVLADVRERPETLIPNHDTLILAKQYPAYDDLYRYGFVHSRVRGYRAAGQRADIFRINNDEPFLFREFEGIDVVQAGQDFLDLVLLNAGYRHICVHILDAAMWEILDRHLDRAKVTIWIHGAEIQTWQRRAFEFEGLDPEEIERRKMRSDRRTALWKTVFEKRHPNLSFVFVSRYVADSAAEDIGIDLTQIPHSIIHNYIDGEKFAYLPKSAEQRRRILSIRPFASRVYGNDLTVQAILELSKRPGFDALSFRIIGDGELFEETVAPLRGFSNIALERRFLSQDEIAALHREYGIFLCPSRMDTQGVSRDEAMASGLVPVTTRVGAIPEFVDDSCGMLVEPENARQLADAITALQADEHLFLKLSENAARRVRQQSGFEQTILRELAIQTSRA